MEIIIKEGYSFNYRTSGGVGSFANIDKPEGLKINIDQINDQINDQYYVSFTIDNIFIQIWCKSYEIKKIRW